MKSDTVAAKRYASALFKIAESQKAVDRIGEELEMIAVITADAKLRKFLNHPNIDISVKLDVLASGIKGQVTDAVFNMVKLLLERRRQGMFKALAESYTRIAGLATGQAQAVVYAPTDLGDTVLEQISQRFGEITGKRITVNQVLDSTLLGGIRVQIGDTLYDASLSGKLNRLHRSLQQEA